MTLGQASGDQLTVGVLGAAPGNAATGQCEWRAARAEAIARLQRTCDRRRRADLEREIATLDLRITAAESDDRRG